MNAEIFAAEINLRQSTDKRKVKFNDTQVKAYLLGLSTCYKEVMLITNDSHLLALAIGYSPALLLNSFADVSGTSTPCFTSEQAVSLLLKIAKGEHWPVTLYEARLMVNRAIKLSTESDCYHELLHALTEIALLANARANADYWIRSRKTLRNPSIDPFDFKSNLSIN